MKRLKIACQLVLVGLTMLFSTSAHATYWNLFNQEGESNKSAQFAIYSSLDDMLTDSNRVAFFNTVLGQNIVGTGSNGSIYWNLFNKEGESDLSAGFATYASLNDMLTDTNRVAFFNTVLGQNIVGTGFNGSIYWNLFNKEGESDLSAGFATYASLNDMLTDTNRVAFFKTVLGQNIVGTGSNGSTYWNLFNKESESDLSAGFATYTSLNDMLTDTNRVAFFNTVLGQNIVDGSSDSFATVPEPASWAMLAGGLAMIGRQPRRRKAWMIASVL